MRPSSVHVQAVLEPIWGSPWSEVDLSTERAEAARIEEIQAVFNRIFAPARFISGVRISSFRGMVAVSVHNPDRFMADLRTMVAQGRKRIGFLIGAGAAAGLPSPSGSGPLIPAVDELTSRVVKALETDYPVLGAIQARCPSANIEAILSRVRSLANVIGDGKIDGLN